MRHAEHFISFFRNEFNKFNNTRARTLGSIYHMILRLLLKSNFCSIKRYTLHVLNVVMDVITFPGNI